MLRRTTCLCLAAGFMLPAALSAQTPAQNDSAAKAAAKANTLPLITTRTLKFTTSEGTWISLDLAPDGSTLVFELLGDLYTLPVTGGVAKRITSGQGYDMQPSFSPDGKQLVFVSDRNGSENLWISDADGSNARALTTGERESYVSPTWAPDGQYIVATKGVQLWIYHRDGGSGLQLTGQPRPGAPANQGTPAHVGAAFGNDSKSIWVNVRGLGGAFFALGAAPRDPDAGRSSPDGSRSSSRSSHAARDMRSTRR